MTKTRRKLAGNTTSTDSRSQRNRADRRGSQLTTRARSSSSTPACPQDAPVAPIPVRGRYSAGGTDPCAGKARVTSMPGNNMIEQDNRGVKSRITPMLGFKVFDNAETTIAGVELQHRIRKGQFNLDRLRFAAKLHLRSGTPCSRPETARGYGVVLSAAPRVFTRAVSRMISRPLYATLCEVMVREPLGALAIRVPPKNRERGDRGLLETESRRFTLAHTATISHLRVQARAWCRERGSSMSLFWRWSRALRA